MAQAAQCLREPRYVGLRPHRSHPGSAGPARPPASSSSREDRGPRLPRFAARPSSGHARPGARCGPCRRSIRAAARDRHRQRAHFPLHQAHRACGVFSLRAAREHGVQFAQPRAHVASWGALLASNRQIAPNAVVRGRRHPWAPANPLPQGAARAWTEAPRLESDRRLRGSFVGLLQACQSKPQSTTENVAVWLRAAMRHPCSDAPIDRPHGARGHQPS